jgi:hypothetical protein
MNSRRAPDQTGQTMSWRGVPAAVKIHFKLVELRVPITAVFLYDVLRSLAGKRQCSPTHEALAQKLHLRSRRHIVSLLAQLRRLKLIEWERGRDANRYWLLKPDFEHVADVMRRERP